MIRTVSSIPIYSVDGQLADVLSDETCLRVTLEGTPAWCECLDLPARQRYERVALCVGTGPTYTVYVEELLEAIAAVRGGSSA